MTLAQLVHASCLVARPEQWRGETLDHRTDIFSFGILMYELLAGERPFQGEDVELMLYAIVNTDPRPIREVNPRLPEATDEIVTRALKKDKAECYQRMEPLVADLEGPASVGLAGRG